MNVYFEMLNDIGVPIPKEPAGSLKVDLTCCNQALVEGEGCLVCDVCGLVRANELIYQYDQPEYAYQRNCYGKQIPRGATQCSNYQKQRGYKPMNHFKEHLKRYMGAQRQNPFPPKLIHDLQTQTEFDLQDPHAYLKTKSWLKKWKHQQWRGNQFYKDTFQLIYESGGRRPVMDHKLYDKCKLKFMSFEDKFVRLRQEMGRHNLPCYYMILELILNDLGVQTYYIFPQLKDDELRQKIFDIFSVLSIQ